MARLRYGLIDPTGQSFHDIWGVSNTTVMASLSLGVVAVFAAPRTVLSIRVFQRAALS